MKSAAYSVKKPVFGILNDCVCCHPGILATPGKEKTVISAHAVHGAQGSCCALEETGPDRGGVAVSITTLASGRQLDWNQLK